MEGQTPREFFETLPSRVNEANAAGLTGSWTFQVEPAGTWTVRVDDGHVSVEEGSDEADCTISTSEDIFMEIVRGERNPTSAYMTGKIRVRGELGAAMKLQRLF
ncbi:MAG: SCP2 sterol-binding domain-containing protein [Gaiellaceae bacterium]